MKKVLLLIIAMFGAATTFAQTISYGINAGVNLSKMSVSFSNLTASTKSLTGFHVGGLVDFNFGTFSLQPGVQFTTKGGSSNDASDESIASSKITLNYIEVPVNLLYNVKAGDGSVFIGGGPYAGFGLSGTTTEGSSGQKEDLHFGSSDDDIANPDFGINLLGGYKFASNLAISGGYSFGLANLSNDNTVKIHNKGFRFSLTFFVK